MWGGTISFLLLLPLVFVSHPLKMWRLLLVAQAVEEKEEEEEKGEEATERTQKRHYHH